MAWNSVEMVDYVFDRYKFLGLTPTASEAEIRAAIRQKRVENHPDQLGRSGPEVRQVAERQNKLLADCEDVLLKSAEKKAAFDITLAEFKATRPLAVSDTGTAIIVFGQVHLDVPVLLGQAEGQGTDAETLHRAKVMSGANPEKTARLRRLYRASPNDPDLRDTLADALRAELIHAGTLEEEAWQKVGIAGKSDPKQGHLFEASTYTEMVQAELDRTLDEDVPVHLENVLGMARLGMASPLLLLPAPHSATEAGQLPVRLEDVRVEDLVTRAKEVMATRKAGIEAAAQYKQQILQELADLTEITWLTTLPRRPGVFTLMLMLARNTGDEPVAVIALQGDDAANRLSSYDDHPALGMTTREMFAYAFPHDAMAVVIDKELGEPLFAAGPAVAKRRAELGLT